MIIGDYVPPAIVNALDAFRLHERNPLPLVRTYMGRAYKTGPPGIIGFWITKHFVNALFMPDLVNYFLIYRHSFWENWREHCNYHNYRESYKRGITINIEIYDDIRKSSNNSQLIVIHSGLVYRFHRNAVHDFIESNHTFAKNQNHGFSEVGIPIVLAYEVEQLR